MFNKEYKENKEAIQRALWILMIGGILLVCYYYVKSTEDTIGIEKPEIGEIEREITLYIGNEKEEIQIELEPIKWSEKEAKENIEEMLPLLEEEILGTNDSLDEIRHNLNLVERLEGFPFEIQWESERKDLLSKEGTLLTSMIEEDQILVLTATISYETYHWIHQILLNIRKTEEGSEGYDTEQLLQYLREEQESQAQEDRWIVPTQYQGVEIQYELEEDNSVWILAALLLVISGASIYASYRDEQIKRQKKIDKFEQAYDTIVSSLAMYMSVGMSIQNAFMQCSKDYREGEKGVVADSLDHLSKNMRNGKGFSSSLDLWALESENNQYRKLSTILIQGERSGMEQIEVLLRNEVDIGRADKLRNLKIQSEKISVKLLFPMAIQLLIVIALIVVPTMISLN